MCCRSWESSSTWDFWPQECVFCAGWECSNVDATDAELVAPAVRKMEELWGTPLTEKEQQCIWAGYELCLDRIPEMVSRILASDEVRLMP